MNKHALARAVLDEWRREIDSTPIPILVDTDTAVAVVLEAAAAPRRR
ncbi:hypothetical protein [Amycolatopsis sp. NPDC006125]